MPDTARRICGGRLQAAFASVIVCATLAVSAQSPAFDVASVRVDRTDRRPGVRILPSGQLTATATTALDLILLAYGLHETQLIDGPAWLRSERFEIVARAETAPPNGSADVLLMLRALLEERFRLRTHVEMRELPAYMLTRRARPPAKPQWRPSAVDCDVNPASPVPNAMSLTADGWPPCGLTFMRTLIGANGRRTEVKQAAVSMQEFAFRLQSLVERPVVDRTGVTGTFDIEYTFTRVDALQPGATPIDGVDLFTALEEQLGFSLDAQRTDVRVLVIDEVTQPLQN